MAVRGWVTQREGSPARFSAAALSTADGNEAAKTDDAGRTTFLDVVPVVISSICALVLGYHTLPALVCIGVPLSLICQPVEALPTLGVLMRDFQSSVAEVAGPVVAYDELVHSGRWEAACIFPSQSRGRE